MVSVIVVDGVTSFLLLEIVTNISKHLQNSQTLAGVLQRNGRKIDAGDFKCGFTVSFIVCLNRHRLALVSNLLSYTCNSNTASHLIFFTTDLQTVNYHSTIHSQS